MEINSLLDDVDCSSKDGKHLIFFLGDSNYGISILEVSEINGLMNIIPVPNTPDFIKGIINLRGKIIPVLDLRLKFGMQAKEYDEQTCIIITKSNKNNKQQMGILVDTVSEVYNIPLADIDEPPNYGDDESEGFLNGIGKVKGKLVMLLNIEKILNSDEVIKLSVDENKKEKEKEKAVRAKTKK